MEFTKSLIKGKLIKRYKRFFADVKIGKEIVTAHCPNTGSMKGLLDENNEVYLLSNNDPKRKLKYGLEIIKSRKNLVGVNTHMANRIVEHGIKNNLINELKNNDKIRPEVFFNKETRFDFLLEKKSQKTFVEVKNVTLSRKKKLAEFPDAVTSRGLKHINELIKAFDKLSKINDNIKLLLVGSMEEDLDPLDFVTMKIINRNNKIILAGYQNDVRPYFSISNCLVFPSYREGFPNVVMQSGAMGLPSIVSNINGCNEIIKNNVNGIIIPVKDTNAIYNSMKKIYDDKSLFKYFKSKSRNEIKKKYERKIFWNLLLNEYNGLLKKNNL